MNGSIRPRLFVAPKAGEPAHGFLFRLAARNAYGDAGAFSRDIGIPPGGLRFGHGIEALELAGKLAPGSLADWSPLVDASKRRVAIGNETLRLKDWSVRSRRWCPACFRCDLEGSTGRARQWAAHHRSWWDVTCVRVCPEHGMRLSDRCTRCGSRQGWNRVDLHLCECGADLGRAVAPMSGDALGRYVHSRLSGASGLTMPLLDGLSLAAVVPIVERLGLVPLASPGTRWAKVENATANGARERGMEIAKGWPRSFEEALDDVLSAPRTDAPRPGLHGAYGWIHASWISTLADGDGGTALRGCLRRHAVRNGIVAEGEDAKVEGQRINLKTSAKRLGMGHDRTKRILAARGALPRGRRRSVPVPVDAAEVARIAKAMGSLIDASTAAKLLGVGRGTLRSMVKAGMIEATDKASSIGLSGLAVEAVNAFADRVRGQTPVRARAPIGTKPLPKACQACGVPLVDAIRLILDGRVTPVAALAGMAPLPGLVVRFSDLAPARQPKSSDLTLQEAASMLGIHPEAMLQLVRVSAISARRNAGQWSIRRSDLERFADQHVSGAELARKLRTSPRNVVRLMGSAGCAPMFGPPSFRQVIFTRSSVVSEIVRSGSNLAYRRRSK